MHKGKKIELSSPLIVSFENNKGKIITLKQEIIALRAVDDWVIEGAKWASPVIEVFFVNIPSYPIGYFRDKIARNSAIQFLINCAKSKNHVHLPYQVYFKPVLKNKQAILKVTGSNVIPFLLKKKRILLEKQGVDFLKTWNAHCATKLNKIKLRELERNEISPEIEIGQFVIDCISFIGMPDQSLKEKLLKNEISFICLYAAAIDSMRQTEKPQLQPQGH